MRIRRPPLSRLALVLLVCTPLAAWALVKPVRVVAPSLAGLQCAEHGVCVENESDRPEADRLHAEAASFVAAHVGAVTGSPQLVFCSTQACADTFGLGRRSAVALGTVGMVIGPRAWEPYYVRHELIHLVQAQRLGTIPLLLRPAWWTEGMAYTLSEDPRVELGQPLQDYRTRFRAWFAQVGQAGLWQPLP